MSSVVGMSTLSGPAALIQGPDRLVGWSQMPLPLLAQILQLIPLADRLSTCAPVCSSWYKAAAAATGSIDLEDSSKLPTLQLYLGRHGECLTALKHLPARRPAVPTADSSAPPQFSQLPCPYLLELQLDHFAACGPLQLGPGSDGPGLLQAATGLTSLSLWVETDWQGLVGGAPSLAALTALPNLQDLSLEFSSAGGAGGTEEPPPEATIPCAVLLPALLQLTSLSLTGAVGIDSLQPVSCLTKLRSLCLAPGYRVTEAVPAAVAAAAAAGGTEGAACRAADAAGQQPLLQHLTFLSLSVPGLLVSSSREGGGYNWLGGLTTLQVLQLAGVSLEPQLLRGMSQLARFEMADVEVRGEAAGEAELVRCICSAQRLTALQLSSMRGSSVPFAVASAAVRHHSNELRLLQLSAVDMPAGGWQGLLGAGRRLPALEELHLSHVRVTDRDVQAVLTCCAGVRALCFLQHAPAVMMDDLASSGLAADWGDLPLLSACTRLTLNGIDEDEEGPLRVLARMSWLRELAIKPPVYVSTEGILELTALRQLTSLEFRLTLCETDYPGVWRRDEDAPTVRFVKEPTSTLPDVWYQLLMFCAGSAACRIPGGALRSVQAEVLQEVQLAGYDATLLQLAVSEGVAEEAYQARYKAHMDAQGLTRYQAPPVVAD